MLKKFNHEFIPIKSVNNSSEDYLYLFRAKLVGKSFACDPNEDKDIIKYFVNVYNTKYLKKCQDNLEKKEKQAIQDSLQNLTDENKNLKAFKTYYEKKINQEPQFSIYTDINQQFGSFSKYSDYFNQNVTSKCEGISISTGTQYFLKGIYQNNVWLSVGLNYNATNYLTDNLLNTEFQTQQIDYIKMINLSNYSESFQSTSMLVPLGIGYQFRQESWPIYFQLSSGIILGLGKVSSRYASGIISYSRYYEDPGIQVINQPNIGLVSNVSISNRPLYDSRTSLFFGGYVAAKVFYRFSKDSPVSGYLNFCFNSIQTKLTSNESEFVSTELNSYHSILNSMDKIRTAPFQLGIGVVYELRNKIKPKA